MIFDEINNFRPMAIVPGISKIFEILIKDRLASYFEIKLMMTAYMKD